MKRIFVTALSLLLLLKIQAQTAQEIQKTESILRGMTLEEKVGQMTQVTLAVIAKGGWGNEDGSLDPAEVKKAVTDHHVGSILNTTAHALPLATWHQVISQIQDEAKKTRLKIPVIYGLDAIHGQTYTLDATLFPQNIAMAATRNPSLTAAVSKITAAELRASGVRWNFAPVLDIGRQPLWSRFAETYGEDVFIGTTMGVAAIRAYEEDGLKKTTSVASCMKHFLGYSASRTGKDRTPIYLPEIEMREYYLPQFRAAVKAGSSTIMINSSEINGVPVHASKYLLTDLLRKELKFEGLIVTDWEDIIRLHTIHRVAATPMDAVAMGVNAGIDMSMVPSDYSFYDLLIEAVKKGKVPVARINDAVRRILLLKFKTGLFDDPYPEKAAIAKFGSPSYQDVALQSAREAMTLLQNTNNTLPLSKNARVLVAGPSAQSISALNGCWSYTWQGNDERWYPAGSKTILQAIADKLGADHVITSSGKGFDHASNYDTTALKQSAQNADAIILCIGENAYAESPGNTRDLALPEKQSQLVKAAINTGKPVVLILTEGRPLFITQLAPSVKGILMAYWSGRKTAEAVADVLFGDYNPDGKLPFSYPKSMGEIVLYDRKHTEEKREILNSDVTWDGYDPLFPFGHGLSYTSFAYSDIKLSAATLKGSQPITVSVTITNTGDRQGKHTVELYSRDLYASITPCVKRLRAFEKIELKPGESKAVSFSITRADLSFVNAQLKTVTEPGEFELMIGDKKASFNYAE
ncbi:glycoside hydrolase family 3 C-terminal domain-containing protein [Terrimonas sp. NA20]|uniref:beta-glucosidase n=1 Tax=Terrimonas ginsenosidimutans TaxID=2908004 RepID=A0ABS9KQ00_9BACT|nr:glycoside hydrolase family 3 N-terminal domain-containing protein [Terrimonas ginsenosidimutans]MCG2614386.1 glycoside hydrolase family 3 C-terminal domain-containing protein [Terrimonas ginsenosidimutans]